MAFYSLFIRKRAVPQNSTRNSSVLWHFILYSSQKGQFPRTPPVQFCGILYSSLKGQLPRGNIWWGVGQWGPRGRGSVTTSHSCCRLSCFIYDVYALLQDVLVMPEHWGGGGGSVMPECFYGISCYGGGGSCLSVGGVMCEYICSCSFLLWIQRSFDSPEYCWGVGVGGLCLSVYVHVHSCYSSSIPAPPPPQLYHSLSLTVFTLVIQPAPQGHAWVQVHHRPSPPPPPGCCRPSASSVCRLRSSSPPRWWRR